MLVPLCVDLDGTLIKSDTLLESMLILFKKNPFYLFFALAWLFRGTAYLKYQVSTRVILNPSTLPYSSNLLAYLNEEFAKGRELILITGANKRIADLVAEHLGIFSKVFGSDQHTNLIGTKKRQLLNALIGEKQFDYAGNEINDLKIWSSARLAIVVNGSPRLVKKVLKIASIDKNFPQQRNKFISFLKAIRVHQYVKNTLIFVPLLTSQLYTREPSLISASIAFVAFCFLASSVYLINDMMDIDADRQHRTKHNRPFASGDLSIPLGTISTMLCLLIALYLGTYVNGTFLLWLLSYFLITQCYTFFFKKIHLLDVVILAIFYVIRIMAGIAAVQSDYSLWLILFSLCFFISLAFAKRYTDVYLSKKENKTHILGRQYHTRDLSRLSQLGMLSGFASICIFVTYIFSNKASELYHHTYWLWPASILLCFWIARVWVLSIQGRMNEDPVAFALEDRMSLITLVSITSMLFMAT